MTNGNKAGLVVGGSGGETASTERLALLRLRARIKGMEYHMEALRNALISCTEATEVAFRVMQELAAREDAEAASEQPEVVYHDEQ